MDRPFDLAGHTALVTGASGTLGGRFARVLSAAGARLVLAARRMDRLETLAGELRADGGEAECVSLDVTDSGSVTRAFTEAGKRLGPVTVIVNNSGVTATRPALDLEEGTWDDILETNLRGAWLVAREGARRLIDAGVGGSIVNVASILGLRVAGHVAPYSASKAGLVQLTRSLALEWARHGIRVNAICPGYVETDLNRDFFASQPGQAMIKRIPQRRLGRPEDLDGPLLLLASDAGRYMTGSTVVVDGGHTQSTL